ncbi:phospholipid/cholesterol/gamma-HCH transport system substrate-binding protein [Haloechinothrix alba]|uniref:Phospholipid/cholesterol/gamma-HCH transport system substrate-binding protein n=2 Tax=Haloechinothrix alba TaxID=664784 RepID=A0A238YJJ1_9PSEU|nr:phospholipid/cholesterol/gamma-HCH transport system substrate-binding protein [Haloechinothrix alba]
MSNALAMTSSLVKLIIFVVVTAVTTAVLGISIANINLTSTETYSARFSDATLLLENDDVRIAGVRVGQVESVQVVDRRLAEVEFSVDSSVELPAATTAIIKYRNIAGQRYVALNPGAGSSDELLPVGGNIPLERTQPALNLTELFNGFKPLFEALTPEDVNKLSHQIIQVMQGEAGTVESLLAHTASLTESIANKDQVIGEVIGNLNEVLAALNERTPEFNETLIRMQELVSGLSEDREHIGEAVEAVGELSSTTSGFLEEVRGPLRNDIEHLGELTENLNEHEGTVEHFIQFMPEKLRQISRTGSYGSWFNFFECMAEADVRLTPDSEPVTIPIGESDAERCGPA